MVLGEARISEVRLDAGGGLAAWIECPAEAIPGPGQYVLGWCPEEAHAPLAVPLFLAGMGPGGFLAAPPLPPGWSPGAGLKLRGPLGRGFNLPGGTQHLALLALGDSLARLMPLAQAALDRGAAVVFYADGRLPALPASLEAYPLAEAPEALSWADFLAVDAPDGELPRLRAALGLEDRPLAVPGQALVLTAMPCGGLAGCGACAVRTSHGPRLACEHGPVFDLNSLEW